MSVWQIGKQHTCYATKLLETKPKPNMIEDTHVTAHIVMPISTHKQTTNSKAVMTVAIIIIMNINDDVTTTFATSDINKQQLNSHA